MTFESGSVLSVRSDTTSSPLTNHSYSRHYPIVINFDISSNTSCRLKVTTYPNAPIQEVLILVLYNQKIREQLPVLSSTGKESR